MKILKTILPLAAVIFLQPSLYAAITTTGNLTGTGTPYNGVDDPWANADLIVGNSAVGNITIDGGSVVNTSLNYPPTFTLKISNSVAASGSSVTVTGMNTKWNVTGGWISTGVFGS